MAFLFPEVFVTADRAESCNASGTGPLRETSWSTECYPYRYRVHRRSFPVGPNLLLLDSGLCDRPGWAKLHHLVGRGFNKQGG